MRFSDIQSAQNAIQALDKRFFSGKRMLAYFVAENSALSRR